MTSPRRAHVARLWRAVAIALAACLLLSGCVYLRLLELKKQLADFDRHFTVQTTEGLRLNFLHPVLLKEDIRWLGLSPSTTRTLGKAEQWRMRWIKEPAPNVREANRFEIVFDFYFTEGRLTALTFSENYFALIPKQIMIASIKSLGGASVDQKNRSLESNVDLPDSQLSPSVWPTRAVVTALLGFPTEQQTDGDKTILRYRCLPDAPDGKGKEMDLRLVFDTKTEMLLKTTGVMPFGKVDMNFPPPKESETAKPVPAPASVPASKG